MEKTPNKKAPCPCGSGQKYKSCCMEKDMSKQKAAARTRKTAIAAVALAAVLVVAAIATASYLKPGPHDAFAKCLTDKGFKMYGASWCENCRDQKSVFGKSFKKINYVECAEGGSGAISSKCTDNNVKKFPTWTGPGGKILVGKHTLEELSAESSCPVESN